MMIVRTLLLLAVLAMLSAPPRAAEPGSAEPAPAARIRETLTARFPEVRIVAIQRTPIVGLFAVITPGEVVYVDATAEYLLAGKLLTTSDKRNLSAEAWDEQHRIDFASLPLDAAIRTVRGKGTRQVAVFSDPDCPFCRKLEQEMAKLDDVTIHAFLFPLEELHKGATARSRAIWCASDRVEAWRSWMLESKQPSAGACAMDPIAGNQALGERLSVTVTPTVFFSDGSRITGARTAQELQKLLTERQASEPQTAASR